MQSPRAFHAAALAVARRPVATLLALLLALSPLLAGSARVRPDNSLDSWFVEGDPALARYHAFLREYGNDEAILVGYETPDGARSAPELALQRRLAERIGAVDGIDRVLAGAAVPAPLAAGLVAGDERASALVAWVSVRPDLERARGRIIAEVRDAVRAELAPLGREAHLAGNGVLYEGLNQQTMRDTGIFLSLALLAMVVLLALGLRSGRAVVLALAAPLLAAAAGMGALGLSGRPFTVVGAALPTLVLVIALADAVHVLLHYEQVRRREPPGDAAARRRQVAAAVSWVAVPCLFTSITTAAGFLALATSRIALVRDFGIFAAIGMLLAWGVTLVFLAAALALWDVPPATRGAGDGTVDRLLAALARRLPALRRPILLGALLLAAVTIAGAVRLRSDTDTIGLLPATHQVRRDSEWIERRLGAYTPLEMLVGNTRGAEPAAFAEQVREWRRRAVTLPRVERTFAPEPAPTSDGHSAAGYVSADGRRVRVTAYVPMMTAKGLAEAAEALEREGVAVFGDGAAVQASGYLPLYVRITDYVVQSTVWGLAVAFVVVFALMAVLVRSRRGMAAAAPVNLLPVLLVFGVMGWAGIALDIATATVGAIVLGIVVDDSIHFLHRYRHGVRAGMSSAEAAAASVRTAGRGIVLTSAVLASGFAVMIAAGTKSIAWFGLVATLAVIGALLADLLLLPALLMTRPGAEPHTRAGEAPADA